MKSIVINKTDIPKKEIDSKASEMQRIYSERLERFMALVSLSYALKTSPRITQKK